MTTSCFSDRCGKVVWDNKGLYQRVFVSTGVQIFPTKGFVIHPVNLEGLTELTRVYENCCKVVAVGVLREEAVQDYLLRSPGCSRRVCGRRGWWQGRLSSSYLQPGTDSQGNAGGRMHQIGWPLKWVMSELLIWIQLELKHELEF